MRLLLLLVLLGCAVPVVRPAARVSDGFSPEELQVMCSDFCEAGRHEHPAGEGVVYDRTCFCRPWRI